MWLKFDVFFFNRFFPNDGAIARIFTIFQGKYDGA